jgi:hypothetical protein
VPEDRVALVRAFLERSFPGHTVADFFHNMTNSHVFRVDAPAPDGRPPYWLVVSEEAMGDQDFDLAGKLTPGVVQTLKGTAAARAAGAGRQVVMRRRRGSRFGWSCRRFARADPDPPASPPCGAPAPGLECRARRPAVGPSTTYWVWKKRTEIV